MDSRLFGKDILNRPTCPFCGLSVDRPALLAHSTLPLGTCSCGAVYALDVTGHNLGSAMVEALFHACSGDAERAWNLSADEDYLEERVDQYDGQSHRIIQGGAFEGRRVAGTLFFVRLRKGAPGARQDRGIPASPGPERPYPEEKGNETVRKEQVEAWVRSYDMAALLRAAEKCKSILRDLRRLLYSADDTLRHRAAEALGRVAAVISEKNPAAVAKLLQNLFSSVTDSASSSWGALDAVGEIISHDTGRFSGYIPGIYRMVADRTLLPDILRCLGKIAGRNPEPLRQAALHFIAFLHDPDPKVRGYAAVLLGYLDVALAEAPLSGLLEDAGVLEVYEEGEMVSTTVGRLSFQALHRRR